MSPYKKYVRDLFRYVDCGLHLNADKRYCECNWTRFSIQTIIIKLSHSYMNRTATEPNIKRIQIEATNFRLDSLLQFSSATWPYTIYITDSSEMKKCSRISKLTLKVWGYLSVWHILVFFIEKMCKFIEMAAVGIIFKNLLIFSDMSAYRQCILFGKFWFDSIAMNATYANN